MLDELPLSRCGVRELGECAGGGMVSSPVSAGCLLRHHLKACLDPLVQRVPPSLQKQIVGGFKELLRSLTRFQLFEGMDSLQLSCSLPGTSLR